MCAMVRKGVKAFNVLMFIGKSESSELKWIMLIG
jgi:hypothetical protein